MEKKIQEISALTRTYNLLLWIIPVLEKFPGNQKFLLGDRIENLLIDIMELIIQAVYSRDKVSFQIFVAPVFNFAGSIPQTAGAFF